MSLVCTPQTGKILYLTIVQWTINEFTKGSTDTCHVRQQNCPKEVKLLKGKNMKYVTRETENLLRDSVKPRPYADSDDRPWYRVREAGSRWWLNRRRRTGGVSVQTRSTRPTAGNTTSERQRLIRQEEAATRHSHSWRRYGKDVPPTNSLHRTVLNSTATHVNGSTSARSPTTPVDTQFSSGTHTDGSASARPSATPTHTRTHSPTTSLTTIGLLSFTLSAKLLERSSSYTVSRLHNHLTVY